MRRSSLILLVLTLAACQPATSPTSPAPRYAIATVAADLEAPAGLAVLPDGISLSTAEGLVALGPEGARRVLAKSGDILKEPAGLAAATGSLFVADPGSHRVWLQIDDMAPEPFAGSGEAPPPEGDRGLALAGRLTHPVALAVGIHGDLYVADADAVRCVDRNGHLSTIAGGTTHGFAGDGGPATKALLEAPAGLAVAPDGSLYIADTGNHRVRRVGPDGVIRTVAGSQEGFAGDDGAATAAQLASPSGLVVLPSGDLLIADTGNHRVRWVRPGGTIATVAGSGRPGTTDEAEDARQASLDRPAAIALAPDQTPFVLDTGTGRLYQLRPPASASARP